MTTYSEANKRGWKTRRKKYTKKQIKEKAQKAGIASAQKRWGYKQSYDEVL